MSQNVTQEIYEHAFQLDLSDYIIERRIKNKREFLANLLCDVRGGSHLEWYDLWFSDPKFQMDVSILIDSCYVYKLGGY